MEIMVIKKLICTFMVILGYLFVIIEMNDETVIKRIIFEKFVF